jgi:hypothetical protein
MARQQEANLQEQLDSSKNLGAVILVGSRTYPHELPQVRDVVDAFGLDSGFIPFRRSLPKVDLIFPNVEMRYGIGNRQGLSSTDTR